MSIKDCLDTLVKDKRLTTSQAKAILSDVEHEVSRHDGNVTAAIDAVLTRRQAAAAHAKEQVARHILKVQEIDARAAAHPQGKKASFLAHLTKDWTGNAKHTNVEYRTSTLFSIFERGAAEFFEKFKPKALGFKEDIVGQREFIRAIFGDTNVSPVAAAAAKAVSETFERARRLFNEAGGNIAKLDSWRMPQSHDQLRIREAGFDEWRAFIEPRLSEDTFARLGEMGGDRTAFLRHVYETLSTGGLNKLEPGSGGGLGKKLANKGVDEHRVLHFKDADAWLDYHDKFGTGSIYGAVGGHLHGMARDIALLEVLGPNPAAMVRWMEDVANQQGAWWPKQIGDTYRELTGNSDVVTDGRRLAYAGMQNTRNLLRASQMGSAVLSSVTDLATVQATADWNGLAVTKVVSNYVKLMNPANAEDRALARRMGLVADATLTGMRNSRVVDDDMGKGLTGKLANAVFEAQGLTAHTNNLKAAFGLEFMATLAEHSGRAFDQLDPALRGALERGGIDAAGWDALRRGPRLEHDGVKFMDPIEAAGSEDAAVREAGIRLHSLILQETSYAVPEPDARVRSFMNAGTRGNTLAGELVRSIGMYRSFPVTVTLTHGMRAMHAVGDSPLLAKFGLQVPRKYTYAAGLLISSTVLGAFALQMKQIVAGKDPRDIWDINFLGQAIMQGGGLGIFGDFFGAALSRTDKDLSAVLMGAGFGLTSDVLSLTTRNALAEAEGKRSRTASDTVAFLQKYTPGSNLWYAKLVTDRFFWAQLKLMADPEAPKAFARQQRNAMRDYQQDFWWRPGQALPDHAPRLSNAVVLGN